MKIRRAAPAALWLLALALGLAALHAGVTPEDGTPMPPGASVRAPGAPLLPDRERLEAQADSLRQRNPFRLERSRTAQPFGAQETVEAPPIEAPLQPRPVLRVGGIVGGPPWKALIEGIPGRESGLLLGVGEEWSGFKLTWIRRDSVEIVTPDTTWILALKQAWR